MKGFNRFLLQFAQDLKLWSLFMLFLLLFRSAFIVYFRGRMDPATGIGDVLLSVLNGMRYDSMVSTYWICIPFLAATVPSAFLDTTRYADRLRKAAGVFFLAATSVAWVVTFGYFKEYNAQFNRVLFNLYYDDTRAIIQTIWADYHPIPLLLVMAGLSWGTAKLQDRWLAKDFALREKLGERRFPVRAKALIVLAVLAVLVVGTRGSVGRRPAQRKDVAVSTDGFLNKAVINPYFALLFAVKDHIRQTGSTGLEAYLPDRNVRKAAQAYFGNPGSYDNLDEYLLRHAKGPKGTHPRHIFLVVMESCDAWPFLDKYASLGLVHNLTDLGNRGLRVKSFLPSSDGTMETLTSIITDLPYAAVEINYQDSSRTPYPSSLFETFKRLGYTTRLFYGGYLSWQRFGDFARDQGVEEVYGAPAMDAGVATHEWGVDDEYLFEFIEKTVTDDRPSFNLIMTTSYHPPYNVDVRAKGFPLTAVPPDIAPLFDGSSSLRMLGHLWYADKCIGDFVKKEEGRLSRPLFAFTGDHFGRKFINARPSFYERSAVPFILYGKDVLRGIEMPGNAAGAHIDIGPTLIELAAPPGFPYYAVGRDLLEPRKEFYGIGWHRMAGKDFLLDLSGDPKFYPLPGRDLPKDLPDPKALKGLFNDAYGMAWWRVKMGPKL